MKRRCLECGEVKDIEAFTLIPKSICLKCLSDETKGKTKYTRYVYLASGQLGIKIGVSLDPVDRLKSIEYKLRFPIELVHTTQITNSLKVERYLHTHFKHKSLGHEWFELTPEDVQWTKDYLGSLM